MYAQQHPHARRPTLRNGMDKRKDIRICGVETCSTAFFQLHEAVIDYK